MDNVALMAKTVGESALVKASGGIKNLKDTIALLEAVFILIVVTYYF